MGDTSNNNNTFCRSVDFVNEKPSFEDVIEIMNLKDLEKMREILLDKKATKDNIRKLEALDKVILSKKKTYENIERNLGK